MLPNPKSRFTWIPPTESLLKYLNHSDLRIYTLSVRARLLKNLPIGRQPNLVCLLTDPIRTVTFNASKYSRVGINPKSYTTSLPNGKRYLKPRPKHCRCLCSSLLLTAPQFLQQDPDSPFYGHIQTMNPDLLPHLAPSILPNFRHNLTAKHASLDNQPKQITLTAARSLLHEISRLLRHGYQHRPPAQATPHRLYTHIKTSLIQRYNDKPQLESHYEQWLIALLRQVRINFREDLNDPTFQIQDERHKTIDSLKQHSQSTSTPAEVTSLELRAIMLDTLFGSPHFRLIASVTDKLSNNPSLQCSWATAVSTLSEIYPSAADVSNFIPPSTIATHKETQLFEKQLFFRSKISLSRQINPKTEQLQHILNYLEHGIFRQYKHCPESPATITLMARKHILQRFPAIDVFFPCSFSCLNDSTDEHPSVPLYTVSKDAHPSFNPLPLQPTSAELSALTRTSTTPLSPNSMHESTITSPPPSPTSPAPLYTYVLRLEHRYFYIGRTKISYTGYVSTRVLFLVEHNGLLCTVPSVYFTSFLATMKNLPLCE